MPHASCSSERPAVMTRELELINKLGLHARAAAKFVNVANKYAATVRVRRDEREVDGKSIMGILSLAAPLGVTLAISAEGPDAEQVLDEIQALIESRFGEPE